MTSQLKVDRISPATGSEIIIDGFGGGEGSIIQTVFFESADLLSATGPEGWPNYTVFPGFEISITPKKSDSTLIVTFAGLVTHSASYGAYSNILRTGTGIPDKFLHIPETPIGCPSITGEMVHSATVAYDKPNTTQAVKYSLTSTVAPGNGGAVAYLNKSQASSSPSLGQTVARLIVQEVSA